ncbi:MAG TPA: hypothetical protein ENH41_01745, partial [Candidatus Omnitrophica bacterium]|nr:hypothetical protein [Candidatus Omnitrophota bacterium]
MPLSFGIGLSRNKDAYIAGREAARQAAGIIKNQDISIAFVFTTVQFNPEKILEGVKTVLSKTPVVGSSGAGIITSSGIYMNAVAVLAISSTKIKFATACVTDLDKKDLRDCGQKLARIALKGLGTSKREIFITFVDGLIKNGSQLIAGIKETLGISLPIIGGSSADDLKFKKTYQFFNKQVLTNSVVGVLVGENATIRIGIKHGWKPLGKPRIATSASGNIIKSIDNKPAISIYEDYFGKDNHEIKSGKLIYLSIRYPLGIYLEGEEEYLLRNAIDITQDGSLICQGDVPQNATLKLMMGTKETTLRAAAQAAEELKRTSGKHKPPKFAIIFDSFSRNRLLG